MKLKYTLDLSLLGSDPTPSGAIVSYNEVEVVWTLVALVSISDRLFSCPIMKRLFYVGCILSALAGWLQTRAISSTSKTQLNETFSRGFPHLTPIAFCLYSSFFG